MRLLGLAIIPGFALEKAGFELSLCLPSFSTEAGYGTSKRAHFRRWRPTRPPFRAHSLGQRQLAVTVRRHRIAVLAKGGVAAAVAHDLAALLAFNVAIDTGHPRVDLVHQQPFAERLDVVGPLGHA